MPSFRKTRIGLRRAAFPRLKESWLIFCCARRARRFCSGCVIGRRNSCMICRAHGNSRRWSGKSAIWQSNLAPIIALAQRKACPEWLPCSRICTKSRHAKSARRSPTGCGIFCAAISMRSVPTAVSSGASPRAVVYVHSTLGNFRSVASAYGTCAGYPPLLDRLAAELSALASNTAADEIWTQVHRLLPSEEECPLCIARNAAEARAIEAVAKRLEDVTPNALKGLSAICLPHLATLVSSLRDGDVARALLQRQGEVLQRVSEDMRRYAIKHDGRRRHLASKEEATVAERGLLLLAGRRQVNFIPRTVAKSPRTGHAPLPMPKKRRAVR